MAERFTVIDVDYWWMIYDNQTHRYMRKLTYATRDAAKHTADQMNNDPKHPYIPR